jgi:chemotaxis protein MotB
MGKEEDMRRFIETVVVVAALGITASGCVSTGTYKEMEAGKNQEIATLQDKVTSLEKQNAGLQKQVDTLYAASKQAKKDYSQLVARLNKDVKKGQVQVKEYQNMMTVELAEQLFFASGSATLKEEGKEVLKDIGEGLKDKAFEDKIIRVVGHTDNVPIATSMFPSNWDLSVARAASVVRYLQEVGVPPERMVAAGRGEYSPMATNDTPEGRMENRRIEIMLIDKRLLEEMAIQSSE